MFYFHLLTGNVAKLWSNSQHYTSIFFTYLCKKKYKQVQQTFFLLSFMFSVTYKTSSLNLKLILFSFILSLLLTSPKLSFCHSGHHFMPFNLCLRNKFVEWQRWWIAEGSRNPELHDIRKILQNYGSQTWIIPALDLKSEE